MSNFFKTNLLALRKKRAVTQTDIGLQVNKGHTTIGNWEKGTTEPSLSELSILSQYFGISIDSLVNRDLSNVHLNEIAELERNVHPNVHGNVHLKGKKGGLHNDFIAFEEAETPAFRKGAKGVQTLPKVVTIDTSGEENAVYVPVKARAGYLVGYSDPEFIEKLPAYHIPGHRNGTYRIFEVDGLSMFNTLQDKDRVVGRWTPISEIREDRVHVLTTKNDGILIKRILSRPQEGKIICKSDNNHHGQYPTIVLDMNEVVEVYYVVDRWTRMLTNPGEVYKRIVDLEADMAIIKQKLLKS